MLVVFGVVGGIYYQQRSKDIVVGATRITTEDRDAYATLIEEIKKENPDLDFGGDAGQVALDDLLLNAAFKQEAVKRNQILSDKDLIVAANKNFENDQAKTDYLEDLKRRSKLILVRAENEAYKQKFSDVLIAKKDVLISSITFDTPYHNQAAQPEVQQLYDEGPALLKKKIVPLMKQGATKEDIGKVSDVVMFDEDKTDDHNYEQYFTGLVITTDYLKGYTPDQKFNDFDDNSSYLRGKVGTFKNTADEIMKLKNVGDVSEIFTSRVGAHMVVRLEGKTNGKYSSWDDFLNHYKNQYVGKRVSADLLQGRIQTVANAAVRSLTSVGLEQANAQVPGGCASHKATITGRAYDTTHNAWMNNATRFRMVVAGTGHDVGGPCEAGHGDKTAQAGTSNNTIVDNCFTPPPNWRIDSHPEGYAYQYHKTNRDSNGKGINVGLSNGWPDWRGSALNGYTSYVIFYYEKEDREWKLKAPVTEVKTHTEDWSDEQIRVNPGETVTSRYKVKNITRTATDRFERWRSMNFNENGTKRPPSDWRSGSRATESSLGGLKTATSGESSYRIPVGARAGERFCWRATVNPSSNGGGRELTGNEACAVVYGESTRRSWSLTLSSEAPPYVEQGGAVEWVHNIVNTDPYNRGGKIADGFNRCMVFSYDKYNPNISSGGGGVCGTQHAASIPPGGPYRQTDDAYILQTDGNTPLGANYCQRYSVGQQAEHNLVVGESPNACTPVVGAKTYLTVNTTSTPEIEPTQQGAITAVLNTSQYTTAGGYPGHTINCNYYVTAEMPFGGMQVVQDNSPCNTAINSDGSRTVVDWKYTPTANDVGKKFCLNASISATNGNLLAPGHALSGSSCFEVVAKPYMKVVGGDIAAASCTGNSSIIAGWNKLSDDGNTGSLGNQGAGAQYAAYAQGVIKSFASGQHIAREDSYGYAPANLSFANTSTNYSAGNFGGNFGGTPCPSNYYDSSVVNSSDTKQWPGIGAAVGEPGVKVFKSQGTTYLTGSTDTTIDPARNIRLYVDGDVIVTRNIFANYAGIMDVAQMPNLTLVAKGNIHISPNVSELNGIFISEKSIYTCSNGTNPIRTDDFIAPRSPAANGSQYSQCANRLTVNGAVVAKKVHLLRTAGSMYMDNGNPATGINGAAEVFKYNPLTWILGSTGITSAQNDQYDSITTLPPVL